MKKKMLAFTGAGILSVALLTGCGAPKADALIDGMYENTFDSANIKVTAEADVEMDVDGEDYSFKGNADFDIAAMNINDTESMIASVIGSADYNFAGLMKDSQTVEAYVDNEEGKTYIKQDGNWYYTETEDVTSSAGLDLSKKDQEKIFEGFKDFLKDSATVEKKTVKMGGEDCYVLDIVPQGEGFVEFLSVVADVTDSSDEFEEMLETVEDELDVTVAELVDKLGLTFKAYVSKKNKYCVGVNVDMSTFDIEGMLAVADMDLEDLADELGVEIEEISINALNFSIECSDIDNVEVEVPSKVTKKAEALTSFGGDDFDWDDDDDDDDDDNYDWDDDDYGWDDDDDDTNTTPEGDLYDETSFGIYDYDGTYLTTMYLPEGFDYSYCSETGTYYALENSAGDSVVVTASTDYSVSMYLKDGSVPEDNEYYYNYSYEDTEGSIGGFTNAIKVVEKYEDDDTYYCNNYFLVNPYKNYYGSEDHVQIKLTLEDDWSSDDVTAFFDSLSGK